MKPIAQNTFKRRLAARTPQLGCWLSLNSLIGTEVVAGSGFDWVLLDMEHSVTEPESVERHLLAAHHGGDAEFVVRIPSIDVVLVKRLLDAGVRSFMFPFVQTVEEARLAVAATRYPPAGIRGVSGNMRANRFTHDTTYQATSHEEVCVIVQVESPKAVAAIADFGTVEGLDAIFIGPNDLAANMGLLGQTAHPSVREKIGEALSLATAAGKAAGILEFNPTQAGGFLKQGFCFAAVGSDLAILTRAGKPLIEAVQAAH